MPLLAWAASKSETKDYLEMFFNRIPLPSWDNSLVATTLSAAVGSNDPDNVRLVAKQLISSVGARNHRLDSPSDKCRPWIYALDTMDSEVTKEVIRMVDEYPKLAEEFLHGFGLVRTQTDHSFHHQAILPGTKMLVRPHDHAEPGVLWAVELPQNARRRLRNRSDKVRVDTRVVPLPWVAAFVNDPADPTSSRKTSFLQVLFDVYRPGLFGNMVARAVVQHKWNTFARAYFLRKMFWYCLALTLLTAASLTIEWTNFASSDASSVQNQSSRRYIASLVLTGLCALLAVKDTYIEAREAMALQWRYWIDLWSWLDLLHIALTISFALLFFAGLSDARPVLAVALYLRWFGTLYYMQPFASTGPLVRMILVILVDMRYFLLILAVAIAAAWSSFRLLLLEVSEEAEIDVLGDSANGLFTMFNLLVLGDFGVEVFTGPYVVLVRLLFVISMMVVPVVLLNLLIALMSDSYERIQDKADVEFQMLQAGIILNIEEFLSEKEKNDPKKFPKWLHVLVPVGKGNGKGESGMAWQGVLNDIKDRIDAQEKQMQDEIEIVKTDVNVVKTEVSAIGNQLNELHSMLTKLVESS